jgi:hypothetical protein
MSFLILVAKTQLGYVGFSFLYLFYKCLCLRIIFYVNYGSIQMAQTFVKCYINFETNRLHFI